MTAEHSSNSRPEVVTHVLFAEIVGSSKLLPDEQSAVEIAKSGRGNPQMLFA
jgi:hypothetical protein